jgi:bacillithiol system protein YtxJ
MNWKNLTSADQISSIIQESKSEDNSGVLILKHSTRCSVSFFAKKNLVSGWSLAAEKLPTYYLDLIAHRDVSDLLVKDFGVQHESPQVLLINNGVCTYSASHSQIDAETIEQQVANPD